MGNALFIVWRESIEALLVIGILYGWLKNSGHGARGLPWLWGGVAAGVALAAGLAALMLFVQSELAGEALEYFQTALLFIAAGLITQMVLWMGKHGRGMKRELEAGAARATEQANWMGLSLLAALAVAREGGETAVFLYGLGAGQASAQPLFLGAGAGLLLALFTAWGVSRGLRFLNYRLFFRISGIVLLFLAAALLTGGMERLIGMEWLPTLVDPVWDSSSLLDNNSTAGSLIASFTGYRSRPSLMLVLVYAGYWVLIAGLLRPRAQPAVTVNT
jgi:high-affinity iron transporter